MNKITLVSHNQEIHRQELCNQFIKGPHHCTIKSRSQLAEFIREHDEVVAAVWVPKLNNSDQLNHVHGLIVWDRRMAFVDILEAVLPDRLLLVNRSTTLHEDQGCETYQRLRIPPCK